MLPLVGFTRQSRKLASAVDVVGLVQRLKEWKPFFWGYLGGLNKKKADINKMPLGIKIILIMIICANALLRQNMLHQCNLTNPAMTNFLIHLDFLSGKIPLMIIMETSEGCLSTKNWQNDHVISSIICGKTKWFNEERTFWSDGWN